MDTNQISKHLIKGNKRSIMDNPEKLATLSTQEA